MADLISRETAIHIAEKYGLNNGYALGKHSGVADRIASEIAALASVDAVPMKDALELLRQRPVEQTLDLCDSCMNRFADCRASNIVFGTGIGNDNVIGCNGYRNRFVQAIRHGDCEKCANTFGTLGCCDTVNNEWVYKCEDGMKRYEINAAYKDGLTAGKKRIAMWLNEPDRLRRWHCSECGSAWGITAKLMYYCPNCGARIDMSDDEWRKGMEA